MTFFRRWINRMFRLILSLLLAAAVGLAGLGFQPTPARAASPTPPAHSVYLPLLVGPAGPLNGDFEKGRVVWSESSTHAWKLILAAGELNVAPHGGSWAAWLGGALTETDVLQQSTRVSSLSPYLAVWRWIAAEETNCGANLARVTVNEFVVNQVGLCATNNTHGWVRQVWDLRAYAGKDITLKFTVSIGSAKSANLYLDDIAFQSAP